MSKRKCSSPAILNAELEAVRGKVSLEETEESWDKIEQGIVQLTQCCNNGGCDFATEMVAGIRSLSRPINHAMNSERSRLSGSTIELVNALLAGLGPSFEPLVSLFMPTLLGLCGRTNKVFTSRAKACILAVIENTQLPSILPYLAESLNQKSAFLRSVAAEGVLACLNCFNPPDIEKDTRARLIEDVIKLTARDASADVRRAGKMIFEAYKALLPDRVESFIAPLTPVIKKYLDVQGTVASRLTSQAHSRGPAPTGRVTSRPIGSLQAQKTSSHSRTTSTQSATVVGVSGKHAERPTRPPSSEPPQEVPAARLRVVSNRATSSSAIAGPSVREMSRQGALRPPPETGPSTMQSTNRREDIPRPPFPTTQGPQRIGTVLMKSHDEKPRVVGGARRILIPAAPLPETDDTMTTLTVSKSGPPSTKPTSVSSLAQTLVSKRDSRNDSVTTMVHSTALTRAAPSAATANTRPSSRTGPRPIMRSDHPTKATSSQLSRSRPPTTEVEQQTSSQTSRKHVIESSRSSQQAVGQKKPVWGGRSSGKASKPAVKALSIRPKPGVVKSSDTSKPVPEHVPLPPSPTVCPTAVPLPSSPACSPRQSPQLELPASGEQSAQVTAADRHITGDVRLPSTFIETTPSRNVGFQESPSKTPITALLSSIQRGFLFTPSSPLSPPQAYVTQIIAQTYRPNSPTTHKDIACVGVVQDSAARQVLEMMDVN
ncbi:clasp N terminal-domain-containing protein [Suillus clintonianus]|uniref:clasp N terminal-domain-containing protein n=1 Tax=Suillus clintonianus TaxID=1904413 RepID=UPI001B885334|nr:clasp N terminal-domain-containing protein [Suillus clintonianus]KAG2150616.1 clasp N terminal-domain-containing protein [Suillus clintonianus]